jgi:hypothetical protein
MTRVLIILVMVVLSNRLVAAPDSLRNDFDNFRTTELKLSYGMPTGLFFYGVYTSYNNEFQLKQNNGVIALSYGKRKKRISFELGLCYEQDHGIWNLVHRYYIRHWNYDVTPIGLFDFRAYTASAEFKWHYLSVRKGFFSMYSSAGIGVMYRKFDKTYSDSYYSQFIYNNPPGSTQVIHQNGFVGNIYLAPFCISVGRQFAGFIEAGLGYKGIAVVGLNYRF